MIGKLYLYKSATISCFNCLPMLFRCRKKKMLILFHPELIDHFFGAFNMLFMFISTLFNFLNCSTFIPPEEIEIMDLLILTMFIFWCLHPTRFYLACTYQSLLPKSLLTWPYISIYNFSLAILDEKYKWRLFYDQGRQLRILILLIIYALHLLNFQQPTLSFE
jgi:hypothetical protein